MNAASVAAQPMSQPASGRAVASLVLGILGLLLCQFLSPLAWFLAWQELRDIRAGLAAPSGQDYATVGMVLGIVGSAMLLLAALVIAAIAAVVVFGLTVAGFAAR